MKKRTRGRLIGAGIAVGAIGLALAPAFAADHTDAPGSTADPAADLTDLYAWEDDVSGNIVAAINFAGFGAPGAPATYDRDVLYTLNMDTDDDDIADMFIDVRFGQDINGDWGVKIEGLPGAFGDVVGDVETTIRKGSALAFAGLRDDPFFFDFEGFQATLLTDTLSFNNTRDSFATTNVTSIVLEFPPPTTNLKLWATTARIGG